MLRSALRAIVGKASGRARVSTPRYVNEQALTQLVPQPRFAVRVNGVLAGDLPPPDDGARLALSPAATSRHRKVRRVTRSDRATEPRSRAPILAGRASAANTSPGRGARCRATSRSISFKRPCAPRLRLGVRAQHRGDSRASGRRASGRRASGRFRARCGGRAASSRPPLVTVRPSDD